MSLIINLSLTVIVATGAADAFVVNPPQGLTLFDELGLTPFGTFQVSSNADLNNFWSPHYWWKAVTENVNYFRFSPLSQSHATGSSNGPHRMTIRSEAVQPSHGAGEQAKLVETVTLEYGPDGRLLNVTRTIVRQVPVEPTSYAAAARNQLPQCAPNWQSLSQEKAFCWDLKPEPEVLHPATALPTCHQLLAVPLTLAPVPETP